MDQHYGFVREGTEENLDIAGVGALGVAGYLPLHRDSVVRPSGVANQTAHHKIH